MKRLKALSLLLCSAIICNVAVPFEKVNASNVERKPKIEIANLEKYSVEEKVRLADGAELSMLNVGDNMVYCLENPGNDVEFAYNINDTVYYEHYTDDKLVEKKSYSDEFFDTKTEELTNEDEKKIERILEENNYNSADKLTDLLRAQGLSGIEVSYEDDTYFIDPFRNSQLTTRATASKNIGMDGLKTSFPAMSKKQVGSKVFNASPKPTVKTTIYCKDSRSNYINVKNSTFSLSAGISVAVAAAKVCLSPKKLQSVLSAFISVGKLASSVNFSRSINAKASVSREAWMYDRVTRKREIRVYGKSATDTFSVGKASDSNPYGWNCNYQSLFDRMSVSETLNEGISIWEYNIKQYGKFL